MAGVVMCLIAVPAGPSATSYLPSDGASEDAARRIVQRAIEVHGGSAAWMGKKDAAFDTTWTHYRDGRRSFSSRYLVKFPIGRGLVTSVVEAQEDGKPVIMGVSGSRSWFIVGEERYEDIDSLRTNRAFVRRAYALLALPFCLDDPRYALAYDGEEVRSGRVVDRVRVEHGLDQTNLYLFDRRTGRLVGMGSPDADPPTTTIGEAHDFIEVEGILLPRTQMFDRIDALTGARSRALTVNIDSVRFDNGFGPDTFQPPPAR